MHRAFSGDPIMLPRPSQLAERHETARPAETICLPIEAARRKAREIINQTPQFGFVSVVENWRLTGHGEIEFAIRRLRAAD
jgi:hypothetical protein